MELIISLTAIFTTSFIIAFSGAIMPGPMLTVAIGQTKNYGISTGPRLIIGHTIVELIILILLIFGLGPFLNTDIVVSIIGIIGAVVLTYLGYSMLKEIKHLKFTEEKSNDEKRNLVLAGALTSISNPYWFIWWTTIGLGYITYSLNLGYFGIIAFFIGHILADFVWYFLVSFVFTKGERFITNKIYQIIVGVCGSVLLIFAFLFGVHSLKLIF